MTRFSVLALMIVVAVAAVLIYSYMKVSELRAVRARYVGRANAYAMKRRAEEKLLKNKDTMSNTVIKEWVERTLKHYRDLEKKYTKAAARPWIAIEPDPPEPPVPTGDELLKGSPMVESGAPPDILPRRRSSKLRPRTRPSRSLPRKLSDL
jgi:hypothetical protein